MPSVSRLSVPPRMGDRPAPAKHAEQATDLWSENKTAARSIPNAAPSMAKQTRVIRVLLVDDHAMVRQGLRTLLESYNDVDVVGDAANGEEALALVERFQPTVVVMDINMPKMNGVEATRQIKARHPDTIVVGLSVNGEQENQKAMRQSGSTILLTKEAAVDQLYAAIHQVLQNRTRNTRTV